MTFISTWITGAGPVHCSVLFLCLLAAVGAIVHTLARLSRTEVPRWFPLTAAMSAPLAYTVYASTLHFALQSKSAVAHPVIEVRQTLLAVAVSEVIYTQILAGLITGVLAVALILGCITQLTPGERPRLHLAGAAAIFTVLLTGTALLGGGYTGIWSPAAMRAMTYLIAGLLTTGILLSTHIRGPGAHVGPVAALAVPLIVAGFDLFAMGLNTAHALTAVAEAVPANRTLLVSQLIATTTQAKVFAGLSLVLALGLAALGPIASWTRHRTQARKHLSAMMLSVVVAGASLLLVSSHLAPFGPCKTLADQLMPIAGEEAR